MLSQVEKSEKEYAAYTARNLAPIYAKVGRHDEAAALIERSSRLYENHPETLVRHAEVLLLRGEMWNAERLITERMALPGGADSPLRQAIAFRLYGLCQCFAGNVGRGVMDLDTALQLAVDNGLGHQAGKTAAVLRWFSWSRSRGCMSLLHGGKVARRVHPGLLHVF